MIIVTNGGGFDDSSDRWWTEAAYDTRFSNKKVNRMSNWLLPYQEFLIYYIS